MKQYRRGENYLTKVRNVSDKKSIYRCEICTSEIELHDWKVASGHDKTCGCKNGKSELAYSINRDGSITSLGGFDITSKMAKGYRGFNGNYVHRIIAEMYLPNNSNLTDINHIDGNKQNNNVENLEWCSRSHNIQHAYDTKLNTGRKGTISNRRRSVLCTHIKTGHTIKLDFVNQGVRFDFSPSKVSLCCNGKRNSHKGYSFAFLEAKDERD